MTANILQAQTHIYKTQWGGMGDPGEQLVGVSCFLEVSNLPSWHL